LQQSLDGAGDYDPSLAGVGLVVFLNVGKVVLVVHHQPCRLLEPARRDIGKPVDPLDPGAVTEMEAGNRIDGRSLSFSRAR